MAINVTIVQRMQRTKHGIRCELDFNRYNGCQCRESRRQGPLTKLGNREMSLEERCRCKRNGCLGLVSIQRKTGSILLLRGTKMAGFGKFGNGGALESILGIQLRDPWQNQEDKLKRLYECN